MTIIYGEGGFPAYDLDSDTIKRIRKQQEKSTAKSKAKLDETRPLTGKFSDYLTDVYVSPCECIDYIDSRSYESGFMNGHSAGIADGMNIMEGSNEKHND